MNDRLSNINFDIISCLDDFLLLTESLNLGLTSKKNLELYKILSKEYNVIFCMECKRLISEIDFVVYNCCNSTSYCKCKETKALCDLHYNKCYFCESVSDEETYFYSTEFYQKTVLVCSELCNFECIKCNKKLQVEIHLNDRDSERQFRFYRLYQTKSSNIYRIVCYECLINHIKDNDINHYYFEQIY